MPSLPTDILDQPAVSAVSLVALSHLDAAAAAAARLVDPTDPEALHDFRVALRRLRVAVRAYPGLHEGIPKSQRRRLRKLTRATNTAREAEVQIAWFRDRSARFTRSQLAALATLRARLRARRRREQTLAGRTLADRFGKLEKKLRRRLAILQADAGAHEASFRGIAAATLEQHAADLARRLKRATPTTPATELHATRIAAKRLRYLLEPVAPGVLDGSALIRRMKQLQDLFGEITDAHVLEVELSHAGAVAQPAIDVLRGEVEALGERLRAEGPALSEELIRQVGAAIRDLRASPARSRRAPSPAPRRRRSRVPA